MSDGVKDCQAIAYS